MPTRIMTAAQAPVRQSSVRAHNLALVLQTAANSADRPSRAAIAAATGLTRATVSALVDDLIAGGLLTEHDPAPRTGAGRPAAGLALNADGPAGLGLEINVDYLAACVMDLTGAVRHRIVSHGDQRPVSPAAALAALDTLADQARAAAAAEGLTLAGAALAVPGLVAAGGLVRVAPNLGWQDVDVPALLPGLAGLPLIVDNEANLAALGELRAGDEQTFLYVSGEIGIGAGIVLDGELYRGGRGWSGEIGHVTVHPDGRPCRCGANGCLEQYAGQEAVAADADLAASALGIALAAVVNLLDIGVIVLGGAYAPELPRLRDGIEAELGRRVLTAGLAPVTLRAAALGADAAMRGAADAVIRSVRDDPAAWLSR
ncbi:ROK family transcriptional regulator [Actinoplanes sp. KI2]|uniref:ROK family protein n=1 Tax=Actinoplanes sp. KI2 TaxID=2983315 RepID=UPI0021D58F11|nr:ROK family protein [Actinoplanes sp. KI2]MCU7722926.1 ROK family transcriptional regulator [Actinoplanes sp. KI2]